MMAPDVEKTRLLDKYLFGQVVLDAGCAAGIYSDYMQQHGKTVFGMDLSEKLLVEAKARNHLVNFFQGDVERISLKPKTFDTTIAFDILEHVDDEMALENLISLTKQRLIISVPQTTHPDLDKLFLLYGHHRDVTHRRTYTKESLSKLLTKFNLKTVYLNESHPLSVDAMFLELFSGSLFKRRLARKIVFSLLKPRQFCTNLCAVVEI